MDGNGSNSFRNTGMEGLWDTMQVQKWKLDLWEQRFDRLEQNIASLAWLTKDANRDHEEKRNLHRDLPRGKPNSDLFLNSMKILPMMKDFQKNIY